MVPKSSLIGFGLGAAIAGGIAWFSLSGSPDRAAPAPESAPVVESAAPTVPVTELDPLDSTAPKRSFTTPARSTAVARPAAPKQTAAKPSPIAEQPEPKPAAPAPAVAQVKVPEPVAAPPAVPAAAPVAAPARAPEPAPVRKAAPAPPPPPNKVTIAAGTTLSIRLIDGLASDRNQTGDTFHATLDQPLVVDDFVIAERGARVEGRVVSAEEAGRVKGVSNLVLELLSVKTSDGQRVAISTATFEKQGDKTLKQDATKVAVGAGVGAAVGAIFGGGKGAAIGSAAGAGAGAGTVMATRGKPVVLPAETRLTFALKSAVTITEKR